MALEKTARAPCQPYHLQRDVDAGCRAPPREAWRSRSSSPRRNQAQATPLPTSVLRIQQPTECRASRRVAPPRCRDSSVRECDDFSRGGMGWTITRESSREQSKFRLHVKAREAARRDFARVECVQIGRVIFQLVHLTCERCGIELRELTRELFDHTQPGAFRQ